jgi:hypothetical protein
MVVSDGKPTREIQMAKLRIVILGSAEQFACGAGASRYAMGCRDSGHTGEEIWGGWE